MTPDAETAMPLETGSTITGDEALALAVHLHKCGETAFAETLYRRILVEVPDLPEALHYYGILKHQTGHPDEAVAFITKAIEGLPDEPGMHNNLGNVHAEQRRPEDAAAAYRAAIALKPDFTEAHGNLGVALRALGRFDEAEASYRRSIALNPRYREGHENLGRLLARGDRMKEALACFTTAMELEPHNAETRRLLAGTYAATGDFDKALATLDDWLDDEPKNPTALHLRAAISRENVPERADDHYIESMFDRFAPSFDTNLARLGYRAPPLVVDALRAASGEPKGDLSILDAGCGTGLCGPLVAPFASRLVGVDLSPKMLEQARERGTYHDIAQAELTRYLLDHPAEFDVVVSADTLCYFGDLHAVAEAAAGSLRPGGLLIFTVEHETGDHPVRINYHGRYSHRADHVAAALASAGLAPVASEPCDLRMERGEPVKGLVVTARA